MMSAINTNTNNSNNTATTSNNVKMNTRKIKVNLEGASRNVDLPHPFTLAALQEAIASSFGDKAAKDVDLSFTYKDAEGDDIVFDKDSELSLALRLCPGSLEITAAVKETAAKKPDPERRLYVLAARNLREYNGVPSMTPAKLVKTLAFLELNPRRLVKQELAPKELLVRMAAEAKKNKVIDGKSGDSGKNDEGLSESVAAGMELMSVEDSGSAAAAAAASGKKNVLHEAFVAGGIRLRPREIRPLLLALDVNPRRLVKLGHVDGKHLRVILEAEKKPNHKRGNAGNGLGPRKQRQQQQQQQRLAQQYRMARGCGALGRAPGGRPKPRGRIVMMRRNLNPVAHPLTPPPPPPPTSMEGQDGKSFVPAKRGGDGHGVGRRCGPRHEPPGGAPPHKRHGRRAGGPEEGAEGAGVHRGPPHGHPRRGGRTEGGDGAGFHRGAPALMRMVTVRRAPGGQPGRARHGHSG
eukprot:g4988.t1